MGPLDPKEQLRADGLLISPGACSEVLVPSVRIEKCPRGQGAQAIFIKELHLRTRGMTDYPLAFLSRNAARDCAYRVKRMHIVVNGEDLTCPDRVTVLDVLKQLNFAANAIVVERNAEILQRSDYATVELAEGDSLELIRFVGGG